MPREQAVWRPTAAAVTMRITIGYGVMLLALRPVAWAAKQISSLQCVSGNRVALGVGTGNPVHGDTGWRAAGMSFADRGRRTDESLRVLPALVAGEPAVLADGLEVTLAAYAEAGAERVILIPSGADWQRDYELAGRLLAAL
jgi:alkanesulfonate monooxygenase SsuD/methylene tetrahydromethanopterin reductase-like flavin-dependent oxidoreductase (luciferase family)